MDEVRLPLAAIIGAACPACSRAYPGYVHSEHGISACPAKCDRGRAPGLAAALGRVVGLTGVALADREPRSSSSGWYWLTGSSRTRNDEVPHRITGHFQKRGKAYTRFPDRDAAVRVMSDALIAFVRSAARESAGVASNS